MLKPEFRALERALLAADVSPRFVCRTIQELSDHYEDITEDALRAGFEPDDAQILARRALGTDAAIVSAVAARGELKRWPCRWPRCAAALGIVSYYALLPAAPLVYCTEHGGTIARWSVSASLAALVTGAMLFSMQLALALA